jgi:glycosyltransferase involved in cell wall biosynthesis
VSSPLRVAFDARSLASPVLRGWDRYTIGLVRALLDRDVEVTLLTREREPIHTGHLATLVSSVRPSVRASVGQLSDRGGLWWEQVSLPRALGGFDIYHAPAEHGVPLLAPCPTVLTLHSPTAHSYADLIAQGLLPGTLRDYLGYDLDPNAATAANAYWRGQVARASAIIAPSAFARDEIVRLLKIRPGKVTAIPLAVDDAFRQPPHDTASRQATLARLGVRSPYMLYVGGYEKHKNVSGLLAMFALVKAQRPDLSLVMAGSREPDHALAAEASKLGLTPDDDARFLVGLGPELTDLYDGAELFVSMSWRESFGLPALEAMTRGVAVVASEWGAATEVVGDGGLLVDPRDPRAAAQAVLNLLGDPTRNARASSSAARFDWGRIAEATLGVYRSLARS